MSVFELADVHEMVADNLHEKVVQLFGCVIDSPTNEAVDDGFPIASLRTERLDARESLHEGVDELANFRAIRECRRVDHLAVVCQVARDVRSSWEDLKWLQPRRQDNPDVVDHRIQDVAHRCVEVLEMVLPINDVVRAVKVDNARLVRLGKLEDLEHLITFEEVVAYVVEVDGVARAETSHRRTSSCTSRSKTVEQTLRTESLAEHRFVSEIAGDVRMQPRCERRQGAQFHVHSTAPLVVVVAGMTYHARLTAESRHYVGGRVILKHCIACIRSFIGNVESKEMTFF